jgi:hypothetical protein
MLDWTVEQIAALVGGTPPAGNGIGAFPFGCVALFAAQPPGALGIRPFAAFALAA